MLLFELFDDNFPSLRKAIRTAILDVLTPLSSHGATEIAIETLIEKLKKLDLGIEMTPEVIKDFVDPNSIPFVSGIDDSVIYMNGATAKEQDELPIGDEMTEPVDPVADKARKAASDSLKPDKPKFELPT